MKSIQAIILLYTITFISCFGDNSSVKIQSKDSVKIMDLENFTSKELDLHELFPKRLNDIIGYADTVFSKNDILVLKTNVKKIYKSEYDPIITIRKITIFNAKQKVYERDNIINVGEIEYNQKLNLLTIPIIFDLENEGFYTICDLVLFDISSNKIIEIDNNLTDLTNAQITDDSSIIYFANHSIFCYKNNQIKELVSFDNPLSKVFKIKLLKDIGFNIIYYKKFPEDITPFQSIIPFDSIYKTE
jgi:hypothetical protein